MGSFFRKQSNTAGAGTSLAPTPPHIILLTVCKWAILCFFVVASLFPMFWLLFSSLKTNIEFQTTPFAWPETLRWDNYQRALELSGLPRLMVNSLVVSSLSTLVNLIVSSLAAYMLSRFRFRFRALINTLITACIFVPIIALMIPYYRIITSIGLYDTLWGLILVYSSINLPISLYLLQSFMRDIPIEMEEAAIIDGSSLFGRFWHIIFPLSVPGLATAGTFVFLFSWNEFIYALLLTSSERARTVQLGIRFFRSQFLTDHTTMFAAITITLIPTLLIYFFFHEKIIEGLTAGAVKS